MDNREHSYCARCNCRRYRNVEGKCAVCAHYQAEREARAAIEEEPAKHDPIAQEISNGIPPCNHIHLTKQVGPLDGGPAKSTRYRCTACGAFVVTAPYEMGVTMGSAKDVDLPQIISDKIEAVARLWYASEPEAGLRERLTEGLIDKLKAAILPAARRAAFMAGWDARGERK